MVKHQKTANGTIKLTFALPLTDQPVSVLGDFNNWDPLAHPLKKRSNGTRSAAVELAPGTVVRFKYLAADGNWFCDPELPTEDHDEYGVVDSVVAV